MKAFVKKALPSTFISFIDKRWSVYTEQLAPRTSLKWILDVQTCYVHLIIGQLFYHDIESFFGYFGRCFVIVFIYYQ